MRCVSVRGFYYLFEIEGKDYHLRGCFGQGLRELEALGVFDKIRPVVLQHIGESEAELYFGIELEIRQIEIASETYRQEKIGGFEFKDVVAFLPDIECRHNAAENIGARIAVAESRVFQFDGRDNIGRFDILALGLAAVQLEHTYVAAAEVHAGKKSEREIVAEPQIQQAVDTEARLIVGLVETPFFTRLGDEAIVCQTQIGCKSAYRKTEVPPTVVGIGAVEQFVVEIAGAQCLRQSAGATDKKYETSKFHI